MATTPTDIKGSPRGISNTLTGFVVESESIVDVPVQEEFASLSKMNPSFTRSVFQDHAVKHFGGNEKRLADNIPLEAGDYELMASVWRKPDRVIRPKDGTFVLELETFDGGFLQLALNSHKGFASYYKTKMPLGTAAGNYSLGVGRLGPTA